MKALTPARARVLLRTMRTRRVFILGDVMLDEFVWGKVSRISPEAPVPVLEVSRESLHLGGAANVACNVRALGGETTLAGVIGDDPAGRRLTQELDQAGVRTSLVIDRLGRPTTIKTRLIAHHQQILRADRERTDEIPPDLAAELLDGAGRALADCQALVVSDYQKGVITRPLMRRLLPLARRQGVRILVDPKVRHFALYKGVQVITPNQLEAEQATSIHIGSEADLQKAGQKILRMLHCDAALITRGEHGLSLFRGNRPTLHVPTFAREVFDVTGAGDTVIATLALALCAGAQLEEAAMLANTAAGIVVGKLGTATASPDEILASLAR